MAAKEVVSDQTTSEKQSFDWKLPNFLEMRKSEKLIKAQSFTFEMGSTIGLASKWKCFLNPEEESEDKKWIGVFVKLLRCSKSIDPVHFNFRFRIRSNKKDDFFCDNDNKHKAPGDLGWGFPTVIPQDGDISNMALSQDGTLTIHITLTVFNTDSKPNYSLSSLETKFAEKFVNTFISDMVKSFCNPTKMGDFSTKVVSKDGKEFMVNRGVLAARSDVFKAMFQTQMAEMENGVVEINDISGEALDVLLHYCHTGKLKNGWKDDGIIEGLTYGAYKYMLEDLEQFLDEVLGYLGNKDNFGRLVSLARRFEMNKAKARLLQEFKQSLSDFDQVFKLVEEAVQADHNLRT